MTETDVTDPNPQAPEALRLRLPATQISTLAVAEAIEALANRHRWPDEIRFHVDLVLEELVQNTVSYGYPDGRPGEIELWIRREGPNLKIRLEDDGVAFDPFSLPEPDIDQPLRERQIGGLGVHFARTFMDSYAYRWVDGRNRIELSKRLPVTD